MKRHDGATGKNDRICSFSENNLPIIRSNPKKIRTFAAEFKINLQYI